MFDRLYTKQGAVIAVGVIAASPLVVVILALTV